MARRRQDGGERYIEADNGFGWTRETESGKYLTTIFGVTYELERRGGTQELFGWYLFTRSGDSCHFWGEWCSRNLFAAVDEASELIAKADRRAEGYEKEKT